MTSLMLLTRSAFSCSSGVSSGSSSSVSEPLSDDARALEAAAAAAAVPLAVEAESEGEGAGAETEAAEKADARHVPTEGCSSTLGAAGMPSTAATAEADTAEAVA